MNTDPGRDAVCLAGCAHTIHQPRGPRGGGNDDPDDDDNNNYNNTSARLCPTTKGMGLCGPPERSVWLVDSPWSHLAVFIALLFNYCAI